MNPISILWSLVRYAIYLFILLLGVALVGQYYNSHLLTQILDPIKSFIEEYIFSRNVYSLLWGMLFVFIFIVGVVTFFSNLLASDPYVSIEDEQGYIHVSVEAIRDFVKKIATANREVIDARAKVVYRKKKLMVSLRLGVSSRQSITVLGDLIKDDIRRKLIDVVGIGADNIKSIEIAVESIDKRTTISDFRDVKVR
ncbi:MAG: alkaline shock response membrane anchor protein AmaP [Spirochaetota bacterium]